MKTLKFVFGFLLLASSAQAAGCRFEIWNGSGIGTETHYVWDKIENSFGDTVYNLKTDFRGSEVHAHLRVNVMLNERSSYATFSLTEEAIALMERCAIRCFAGRNTIATETPTSANVEKTVVFPSASGPYFS